ncbi:glyco_hydro_56 domain-containing protein [Sebastes umbrosus]|uniref:glyco_hydro_56 domain-containing protein n=1 Tax=Sebastes umbrosus TaxID=72105 RepID=UPI00189F7098|nr:glyco_hydro_56 domain-containing protein [Sebastes umbrosus]XP_037629817.1 glyco_hydro_56 domain-containing protein [Sebastes umbrosus]
MAWTEPRPRPDPKPEPKPTPNNLRTQDSSAILQVQPPVLLPLLLLLAAFADLGTAGPTQPACPPLLSGQPFIIFWGIPDSSCSGRPDPRSFGMEKEGRVAVFYEDTLGNYPYFIDKDTLVNKGLPQHTRLDNHLQKTQQDLEAALPAQRYLGLGVLRWAEWVPQWSRNRDRQAMYLEATRKMLKTFFPNWTPEEVEKWSQVDFEAAAQSVMMETLREVQRLRPKALWGVSPYPSCYNGDPAQTMLANYTGQCPATEMALNDELLWLWKRCSALYPLLTLEKLQGGTSGARLYLSSQIREALRVSSLTGSAFDLPVFPLVKSVYASTNTFLSQADLVSTIGESAAMGTAGVVIWERSETKTERECQDLAQFVRKVLGPYSINVTTATRLCSASLCQGKGRCVRQNPESSAYLHLPPPSEVVEKVTEKVEEAKATDQPDINTKAAEPDPAEIWKKDFQCQWYKTADGDVSDQQSPKDGVSVVGKVEENDGDLMGTTTASTTSTTSITEAAFVVETTKAASVIELSVSSSPDTGSPTPSLEVTTDGGTSPLSAPSLTVLLLLVAASLCLEH